MSEESTMALRMEQVSKRYPGTLAVDRVDFEARVGEVHALMGENGAGKSSLMKLLAGSFTDYTGRVLVHGREVALHSPSIAMANGIGMIYQELSLARPISIAENLLVGRLPRKGGIWLDRKSMISRSKELLARVGLDLDPLKTVDEISQHQAQLVEIARVLGTNPAVLVMDEPTSSLSRKEVERLFAIIRDLKEQGLAIIYISHHLNEIFEVADRVTVMRDGRRIDSKPIGEVTPSSLVRMMVGQTIDEFYVKREAHPGKTILKVRNLSRWGFFHNVSFEVRKGEILGVAGLAGAGRSEMARTLCGLDPMDRGSVDIGGTTLENHTYADSIGRGLVYLSEDRKKDGLFLRLSVKQNAVSAVISRNTHRGIYNAGCETGDTNGIIEKLAIIASSADTDVSNLSGGNQQKVMLGKWLLVEPEVLILDEPSRGVDVKSKMKIHEAVMEQADAGRAVIIISSDLPELVGLSDRAVILKEGHLIGELSKKHLNEETVLLAMNGEFPHE
jgi:ABC-type sugar transport system ATPase subunit